MAETRIQFLKGGVAQCNGHFAIPPERICPGDGIHQFDFRFTNASSAPRSEAAPDAMQKTETPASNPKHNERRATPQASLCCSRLLSKMVIFGRSGPRSLMIHVSEPEHEANTENDHRRSQQIDIADHCT